MADSPLKESAVEKLHQLEHSAVDAYHTIEDHNPDELRRDVRGLLDRLADRVRVNGQRFWQWYKRQPIYLRIAYGLTLLPLFAVAIVAGIVLAKFGGPLLLGIALAAKLSIAVTKTALFVGYIGYKILKTILLWYYTISRLYLGGKAKRQRHALASCDGFNIRPDGAGKILRISCHRKHLTIARNDDALVRVLFSYFRYALEGQYDLLKHIRHSWSDYFTLWKKSKRSAIKEALAPIGAAMFTPHTLGPDVTTERVLVPGDAELIEVTLNDDQQTVNLVFRVRWVDWHWQFFRAIKFVKIEREVQHADWHVEQPFRSANANIDPPPPTAK